MRKTIIVITVIALIISVVGTGVIVFIETKNTEEPITNAGVVSAEVSTNP